MTVEGRLVNKLYIFKTICIISTMTSIVAAQQAGSSSDSNPSTGYKLVWSDEIGGFDSKKIERIIEEKIGA